MTRLTVTFFIVFVSWTSILAQTVNDSIYNSWWKNKESSIFESIDSGKFYGKTIGYLKLINNKDTLVLDFQSTKTTLTVNKLKDEVYDNNTKTYLTKTTSGKTALQYETYMLANILTINLNGEHYSIGVFDGACDMPVLGMSFNYYSEQNTEYLTLFVTKALELTTTRHIMKTKNIYYQEALKSAKTITVLPDSRVMLIIKK